MWWWLRQVGLTGWHLCNLQQRELTVKIKAKMYKIANPFFMMKFIKYLIYIKKIWRKVLHLITYTISFISISFWVIAIYISLWKLLYFQSCIFLLLYIKQTWYHVDPSLIRPSVNMLLSLRKDDKISTQLYQETFAIALLIL